MSDFIPRRVTSSYEIDIIHDPDGHWTARDRDGLTGGTFLTRKDALRFALFETGGDRSHVHLRQGYPAPRKPMSRRQNPPGQSIDPTAP
ncbi:MAG TPA: hypothetical protein VMB84_05380 [Stellaceae bacterium]|nr:hypothetical protein [Stellaceae bacterium]